MIYNVDYLNAIHHRNSGGSVRTHATSQYDEHWHTAGIFDCGMLRAYFTVKNFDE